MPCDAGPMPGSDDTLYERLNSATRAACEMAAALGPARIVDLSAATIQWVREHEEMDRQRVDRERAATEREENKRKALKKLSAVDRKALGL